MRKALEEESPLKLTDSSGNTKVAHFWTGAKFVKINYICSDSFLASFFLHFQSLRKLKQLVVRLVLSQGFSVSCAVSLSGQTCALPQGRENRHGWKMCLVALLGEGIAPLSHHKWLLWETPFCPWISTPFLLSSWPPPSPSSIPSKWQPWTHLLKGVVTVRHYVPSFSILLPAVLKHQASVPSAFWGYLD